MLLGLLAFSSGVLSAAEADGPHDAATLLARPLFDPGRRPVAARPAPKPPGPVPPRLSGTVLTPTRRLALFVAEGVPVARMEGERVGSYDVTRIEAGRVTLASPWGVLVLHPAASVALVSQSGAHPVQALLAAVQDMR